MKLGIVLSIFVSVVLTACGQVNHEPVSTVSGTRNPIVWGCKAAQSDAAIEIQEGAKGLNLVLESSAVGLFVTPVVSKAGHGFVRSDEITTASSASSTDSVAMFINYVDPQATGYGAAELKSNGTTLFNGNITCERGVRVIKGTVNF